MLPINCLVVLCEWLLMVNLPLVSWEIKELSRETAVRLHSGFRSKSHLEAGERIVKCNNKAVYYPTKKVESVLYV